MSDAMPDAEWIGSLKEIRERWIQEDSEFDPSTDEQIRAFERKYSVCLPDTMRTFYQIVNGNDVGNGFIRLYPLDNLKSIAEVEIGWINLAEVSVGLAEAASYFVIGRYDVDLWFWVTKLTPDCNAGAIHVICTTEYEDLEHWQVISPDFTTFIQAYVNDGPTALLGYD